MRADDAEREIDDYEEALDEEFARCVYLMQDAEREFPPGGRLYTLQVALLSGCGWRYPLRGEDSVVRVIEMQGEQTLRDLHWAIYSAFDRDDQHLYLFEFGRKPGDRSAVQYVLPGDELDPLEGLFGQRPRPGGRVDKTTLDALNLRPRDYFFYWFDFGDDWWHRIKVLKVSEDAPGGTYPRLIKVVGKSPPQYGP